MSLEHLQRVDAPRPSAHLSLRDRYGVVAAHAAAERARRTLGAMLVNISRVDADGTITELAIAPEPGARYERTIAAARRIVPGFEPLRVSLKASTNPIVASVHLDGRTVVAPMGEFARGLVSPLVVRVATVFFDMRWSLCVALRVRGKIVGSLGAHFPKRPSETERARGEAVARDLAAELERLGLLSGRVLS